MTDRRRAERALRDSEARFRGLFEQAADAIFVLDPNERILDANRQACQILGYTHAELTALAACDLDANNDTEQSVGETRTVECAFRRGRTAKRCPSKSGTRDRYGWGAS